MIDLVSELEPVVADVLRQVSRTSSPRLFSISLPVAAEIDPAAVAFAARREDEPLFVISQPDRSQRSIAALGEVICFSAESEDRFEVVDRQWRAVAQRSVAVAATDCPILGPKIIGGFAFSSGRASGSWEQFGASKMVVPALAIERNGDEVVATVSLMISAESEQLSILAEIDKQLERVVPARLPLLDPDPVSSPKVNSVMPPQHYEAAIANAVERIKNSELSKIVLARAVQVTATQPHQPAAVFAALQDAFPSCFVYAAAVDEAVFVGASPELLARSDGGKASTVALAGSARRSADPAVDDHLAEGLLRSKKDREEHEIVVKRITERLSERALWVTAAPEPGIAKVANIQHLATPIRAQFADPVSATALAGLLHPTPAIGGEPRELALELIPALEGLNRGWYAGTLGYEDANGDGEFCVALRCALIEGTTAHCYAGVGVVADSQPAAELAETEIKLQAILPLLVG